MSQTLYDVEKLKKVVGYVAAAQPIVEKAANMDAELQKRVPEVVDVLIRQGLLSPHLKEATIRTMVENPVEILSRLVKTAALVAPKSMGTESGKASEGSKASANDVFATRLLG